MRIAAIALAATGLLAGVAQAAPAAGATDLDFLKANRCRGLAVSGNLAQVDVAALDAYIKDAARLRGGYLLERARNEQARAKREAKSVDRRARLGAELTGPCMAYMGGAQPAATAQNPAPSMR